MTCLIPKQMEKHSKQEFVKKNVILSGLGCLIILLLVTFQNIQAQTRDDFEVVKDNEGTIRVLDNRPTEVWKGDISQLREKKRLLEESIEEIRLQIEQIDSWISQS